jgi:long-chain acyl-CoA synthetase
MLDQGKSLIIFPEGTRSKTGEIQSFKSGIGILMAGRKEPIIPAYINGAIETLPKGTLYPRKFPITITIGNPLFFDNYESNNDNWQSISEIMQNKVEELRPF